MKKIILMMGIVIAGSAVSNQIIARPSLGLSLTGKIAKNSTCKGFGLCDVNIKVTLSVVSLLAGKDNGIFVDENGYVSMVMNDLNTTTEQKVILNQGYVVFTNEILTSEKARALQINNNNAMNLSGKYLVSHSNGQYIVKLGKL